MLYALIVLGFMIMGAYLSAWHGGNAPPKNTIKFIKNVAWAFPAALMGDSVLGVAGYVLGLLNMLKASGHGAWIDLGHNPKEPGNGRFLEKIEYAIYPWLWRLVPRYWYDVIGLSLHGLLCVSGSFIVYLAICWPAAVVQAIGGLLKGAAYMIGWKLFPNDDRNTRTGEILSGAFAYAGLIIGYLMVLNV